MNILVLGCGHIGRSIVLDLAHEKGFNVSVVDINDKALEKIPVGIPVKKIQKDISNPDDLNFLLRNIDIVVNAVPGFMGFNILKEIIKAKINVVDIAFFPENPFELDELAKQNDVTAVVDCGVAPGMSNLLAGYVYSILDKTESILIFVGGLPVVREFPYEYKAGFSPLDVIEEYTRPARYIENGKLVARPALSDPELINIDGIGTLEAFLTDGLRTLIQTLNVPNMKEKTLRYPGHRDKILLLRESGFFNNDYIEFKGINFKPVEFTSKLLFPIWELREDDEDLTIMRIIIEGEKDKKKVRYTYDLLDRQDEKTKIHSMARTTGYTATAVVRLLAKGMFNQKGICPPEFIGQKLECVNFILDCLKERRVIYHQKIEVLKQF